jgi:flavorubredoxin
MQINVDEIADNIFRISLFPAGGFIGFNHFLLRDAAPALIHTGHRQNFQILYQEMEKLINPRDLRYLCFSHMEPDECGNVNDWLKYCPQAEIALGKIGMMSMRDYADRPGREMMDGEELDLGTMRLRILITPHFPHQWDGCLFYETTRKVLFGSDLAAHPGLCKAVTFEDISDTVLTFQEKLGFIPYGLESLNALKKLQALPLECLATMHGSAVRGAAPSSNILTNLEMSIKNKLIAQLGKYETITAPEPQTAGQYR